MGTGDSDTTFPTWWILAFVALKIADATTTYVALRLGYAESNPFAWAVMSDYGTLLGMAAISLGWLLVTVVLVESYREVTVRVGYPDIGRWVRPVFYTPVLALTAGVVLWNVSLLVG